MISSVEVPIRDVVVKTDAVSRAVFGQNGHDIRLLLWREQILTMMIAVVRATTFAEISPDIGTCFRLVTMRYVIIDMREAPSLPYQFSFIETPALPVFPVEIDPSRDPHLQAVLHLEGQSGFERLVPF